MVTALTTGSRYIAYDVAGIEKYMFDAQLSIVQQDEHKERLSMANSPFGSSD